MSASEKPSGLSARRPPAAPLPAAEEGACAELPDLPDGTGPRRRLYLLLAGGLGGLLAASVLLGVVIGNAISPGGDSRPAGEIGTHTSLVGGERQRELEHQRVQAEHQAARDRLQQGAEGQPAESESSAQVGSSTPTEGDTSGDTPAALADPAGPFADIMRPDRSRIGVLPLLELPMRDFSLGGPRGPALLAKINASSPQECDLVLVGSEVLLGGGREFRIDRADSDGARSWTVSIRTPNVFTFPPIGTFLLRGKAPELDLSFAWASPAEAGVDSSMLRYCLLNVAAGDDQVVCALSRPLEVPELRLDLDSQLHREPIPLEIPREVDEQIRLDVSFTASEQLPCQTIDLSGQAEAAAVGSSPGLLTRRGFRPGGDQPLVQLLAGNDSDGSQRRCVAVNVGFRREGDSLELIAGTLAFPAGFEWKPGSPPTYRFFESSGGEAWSRADFAKHRASVQRQRSALEDEKTLRTFDDRAKLLAALAENLKQQKRKDAAAAELAEWQQARQDHQRAIQRTTEAATWCDDLLAIFDQIERELRIGYRVYIVIDGHEIELIRTTAESR